MKKTKNKRQRGFIALFFILGISLTFLSWISLSSSRVFEYLDIKSSFVKNRAELQNALLCADAFVNIIIQSKNNLSFLGQEYRFTRTLYVDDGYGCHIQNIQNGPDTIFFIIGDFGFEYQFKNGFVDHITSFNLF
jgi:hypothetical protein